LEEPAAFIFRVEVKLFEKELCGHRRERSINCRIQSHLTFAFPDLSFQFMLLYISLLLYLLLFTYYVLLRFILLFILHLPPLLMNVVFPQTHAIWWQQMLPIVYSFYIFFLVLFYLHILSYTSLPVLCYFILCFIFTCGIYHKTTLFKGHWFLP
jgi:hypothetical protein